MTLDGNFLGLEGPRRTPTARMVQSDSACVGAGSAGYVNVMLTILLIVLLVVLLTGGIGYGSRRRRI